MELKCPSYSYVSDMTWAEFQIRSFGYKRIQEKEELLTREIAWNALVAPHSDPKKIPKTKDKFWQIGEKKSSVTDEMKARIKKAQNEYFNQVNGKR